MLIEFGDRIDHRIHDQVLRLDKTLAVEPFAGFLESVPAYAGILIRFDPLLSDHAAVEHATRQLLEHRPVEVEQPSSHEVLVCYDGDLAPDLESVATTSGLTPEQVIAAHLEGRYDVFMYGFAPGYAYLAGVPEVIHLPRKSTAIRGVAAGSVLIAGPQCLVSTLNSPTGWWIIGRSPTRILTGNEDKPFLFNVGDQVRFRRISRVEYDTELRT